MAFILLQKNSPIAGAESGHREKTAGGATLAGDWI